MIDEAIRAEMRRLVLGEGWKINTVARRFGVHHGVVRRAAYGEAVEKQRVVPPSVLEPYKAYIVERLEKFPELTGSRLLIELRERGYSHGGAVVRRFVAKVRGPREKRPTCVSRSSRASRLRSIGAPSGGSASARRSAR